MTTKLTWYGHAALGLETDGHKIVVDPFLNGNPAASISPTRWRRTSFSSAADMAIMWAIPLPLPSAQRLW